MPLRKKRTFSFRKFMIIATIVIIIALMILSFSPVQNITEVVLS